MRSLAKDIALLQTARVTYPKGKIVRVWRWPLRSGLATTLAFMGTQQTLVTGCGGLLGGDDESNRGAPSSTTGGAAGVVGGVSTGGTTGFIGSSLIVGSAGNATNTGGATCVVDTDANSVFTNDGLSAAVPWPLVLYSWTTAEQVAELRAKLVLFSRSERTGLGRGLVFDSLTTLAAGGQDSANVLAKVLGEQVFAVARFGWVNPWATRMGWPGEQYGDQLLRIELRSDAWIAEFDGYSLRVTDANRQYIPTEQALASPERIGVIYFLHGSSAGGSACGTFGGMGDGSGFREFVLGNPAMVKQWSLGTQDIRAKLDDGIAKLKKFLALLQACPPEPYNDLWNGDVVCNWFYTYGTSANGYSQALSLPSEYYYPSPDRIQTIIDTLLADPFPADPLVVDVSP